MQTYDMTTINGSVSATKETTSDSGVLFIFFFLPQKMK